MKRFVLILFVIHMLAIPRVVAQAAEFSNPDGHPGTVGLEPVFGFVRETFDVTGAASEPDRLMWRAGMRMVVPLERATIFLGGLYATSEQNFFAPALTVNQESYSLSVSVRFWLGGKR